MERCKAVENEKKRRPEWEREGCSIVEVAKQSRELLAAHPRALKSGTPLCEFREYVNTSCRVLMPPFEFGPRCGSVSVGPYRQGVADILRRGGHSAGHLNPNISVTRSYRRVFFFFIVTLASRVEECFSYRKTPKFQENTEKTKKNSPR